MIEAAFHLAEGSPIPVYLPEGEILEIAKMAGFDTDDLFSVTIPIGASREARVKVLVSQDNLNSLYASKVTPYDEATAIFKWRSSANDPYNELLVWLLPPRPIFMVPDSEGVALVEAVDARYWWKRQQSNLLTDDPIYGWGFTSDGRWRTAHGQSINDTKALLDFAVSRIGVEQANIDTTGFLGSSAQMNRLVDQIFTPEMSLAMVIDIIASSCGVCLVYNSPSKKYELANIVSIGNGIKLFAQDKPTAVAGGAQAPATYIGISPEPLVDLWSGQDEWQLNLAPKKVTFNFPFRQVEGQTYYNNNTAITGSELPFDVAREYGMTEEILTSRSRPDYNNTKAELSISEPRPLLAGDTPYPITSATPATNLRPSNATSPNWEYDSYIYLIKTQLEDRLDIPFGKIAWGGWRYPYQSLVASYLRFYIGHRNGQCVPIMLSVHDEKDWLYGPDGLRPDDPRDIVIGKGLVHARRLGSGVVHIDAAPPNTRTFPALILSSTRIGAGGNTYWRWEYDFEEVEPTGVGSPSPMTALARYGTARNMVEEGNRFFNPADPRNIISTGVKQSDYANATIDALPIIEGTVVMMVEQFPTAVVPVGHASPEPPYGRQYWFALPNAVKVTCGNPFIANDDYGTFADPSGLSGEFGTFDAPEGTVDYGWFTDDMGTFANPSALVFDYGSFLFGTGTMNYGMF